MSTHDVLRQRIYARAGLIPRNSPDVRFNYENLRRSEWSNTFETLMRNRLIMGALRYGLLGTSNKNYDRITSMIHRLKLYQTSGNLEHLVDVANLCLCEFVDGKHPNKHFNSLDEHEHHCTKRTQAA